VTQDWWRTNDPGTKQGWHLARTNDADWAPILAEGFWESTVPGLVVEAAGPDEAG
jgi:sialate O-acetylesterase